MHGRQQFRLLGLCSGLPRQLVIREAVVVCVEFLTGDEDVPVDHFHEKALQVVHVLQCGTTDRGDVLVRVEGVIEHLGGDQYCGKD